MVTKIVPKGWPDEQQPRVLLVEDTEDKRDMLKIHLVAGGFDVCCVSSAREALNIFHTFNPLVIVSDVSMPDMDGYGLMKRIHAEIDPFLPFILQSAQHTEHADMRRGMNAGATDYFFTGVEHVSSFELEYLFERTLQAALRRRELLLWRENGSIDDLTRLPNRPQFHNRLREQASGTMRSGGSFCLALIDVDDFKSINDLYGHLIGDQALRSLAGFLGEHKREVDLLFRLHGDEFALILPTTLDDATLACERLMISLRELVIPAAGTISVTIGLAEFYVRNPKVFREQALHDKESLVVMVTEEFFREADGALYEAKDAGKRRLKTRQYLPEPSLVEA